MQYRVRFKNVPDNNCYFSDIPEYFVQEGGTTTLTDPTMLGFEDPVAQTRRLSSKIVTCFVTFYFWGT